MAVPSAPFNLLGSDSDDDAGPMAQGGNPVPMDPGLAHLRQTILNSSPQRQSLSGSPAVPQQTGIATPPPPDSQNWQQQQQQQRQQHLQLQLKQQQQQLQKQQQLHQQLQQQHRPQPQQHLQHQQPQHHQPHQQPQQQQHQQQQQQPQIQQHRPNGSGSPAPVPLRTVAQQSDNIVPRPATVSVAVRPPGILQSAASVSQPVAPARQGATQPTAPRPAAPARQNAPQSTVKELLDWLAPRLTVEQQQAMATAQAKYRIRTAADPNAARTELITQIQVICGEDNMKRFHLHRAQTLANRVASPTLQSLQGGMAQSGMPGGQQPQQQPLPPLQGGTAPRPASLAAGVQVPAARLQPVTGTTNGMSPVAAAHLLQQQRQQQQQQARGQQQGVGVTSPPATAGMTTQPPLQQQQQQARGQQPPPKAAAAAADRDDNFADVLTGTGINEDAEQAALTSSIAGAAPSGAASAALPPPPLLFSQEALHHQLTAIAVRNSVRAADQGCHPLMAHALKAHLVTVLTRAVAAARHRGEGSRGGRPKWAPPDQPPSRDLRREVLALERRAKEAADAKARKEREELLAKASRAKQVDLETHQKVQKAKQDESERLQQLAANKAAASATGASKKWNKWGEASATAAADKTGITPAVSGDTKKGVGKGAKGKRGREDNEGAPPPKRPATAATAAPVASPSSAATRPPEGAPLQRGGSATQPLQSAARIQRQEGDIVAVDLRDLICVMERDPLYTKSLLLYELMESQQ